MQRWIPFLAVLLGVQLVIAAWLGLRPDQLAPGRPSTALLPADIASADRLEVFGPTSSASPGRADADANKSAGDSAPHTPTHVVLVKHDGRWTLPDDYGAPADSARIEGLLKQLASVRRGFPIATSHAALARFKVGDKDFERRLVASRGGKPVSTVYLGESAGPRKADARTAQDQAVYSVDLAAYDFPSDASGWVDEAALARNADKLSEVDVSVPGHEPIALVHSTVKAADGAAAAEWNGKGLASDRRIDEKDAQALAAAIANLKFQSVLGTQAQAVWQQDHPELTLTLKDAKGSPATWTLSKASTGDMQVLKSSEHPWFVKLESWNAKQLLQAAAPDKLVVARGPAQAAVPASAPVQAAAASAPAAATSGAAPTATAVAATRHAMAGRAGQGGH